MGCCREVSQELLPSIVLAAIGMCDIPATSPISRPSAAMSANTVSQDIGDLYQRYRDANYLPAIVAVAKIAVICTEDLPDSHGMKLATETLDRALQAGAPDIPDDQCVPTFKAVVDSVLQLVNFDDLSKGRVPRSAVGSFEGLRRLVDRQLAGRLRPAANYGP
jgi:hypothetical protein